MVLDRGLRRRYCHPVMMMRAFPNTPAWAEKITGVKQADIIRSGREFADNASKTMGKSMVILGAGLTTGITMTCITVPL